MTETAATVDIHLEAYGETDPDRRADLIAKVWAPDGELIDPPLEGKGHAGIDDMAKAVHEHFPGHTFRRTSAIDEHHGFVRYGWELVGGDGTVAIAGVDIAELEGGRIRRVTGFFGELPPPKDD
jgi:hypothetical protein